MIAAWLALTATGLLTAGTAAVAATRGTWAGTAGGRRRRDAGRALAVAVLLKARADRAALLRRKRELGG